MFRVLRFDLGFWDLAYIFGFRVSGLGVGFGLRVLGFGLGFWVYC